MYNVTQEFLNAIKQNGRQFQASVTIGDIVLNDDNIVEFSLEEDVNPADSFMLGSVASNKFEATLIDISNFLVLENATITPRIELLVGDNYEEVPLGVFTVDEITKDKNTVKITCFDNMIKLEGPYFSNLSYPANINDVAQEICTKARVEFITTFPSTKIDEIEGYTYREAISFIASFLGGFARFNRLGKLEIVSYTNSNFDITEDNYFKLKTAEKPFAIGRLACKAGEDILNVGTLGNEIQFENPIMTQEQLNNIYNTLKTLSYMPYTMDWQGNPALMAGDKITIIDVDNNTYSTFLMQQKLTYKGGLSATATAKGKTERAQEFNSGGSTKNRVDKLLTEQANIKILLAESATIQDLSVLWADIENLHASKADIQDLNVTNARIGDLEVNKLDVDAANIKFTNINNALIKKADVQDLNVTNAKINTLEVNAESVNQLLAGNIGAENIQVGAIQAGSAIIADGAIGNNQVSNLSASKLSAGTIDTSIVTIKGSDGKLNIIGNRLQVLDNGLERVALGDVNRDGTVYGLRVRGEDGETVLFDENGLTKEGLTDGSIDDSKVANNAHIDGSKLDIDSVVRNINYFGTENIAVTKVQIGDRTLDVELSTQNSRITDNSTSISNQATTIKALDNAIRLKVDNQTFVDFKDEMNEEISTIDSQIIKNTTAIDVLQREITLKVTETDVKQSINNIQVGGRNLLENSKGDFVLEPQTIGNYNYYEFECDMKLDEQYTISCDMQITHGEFNEVTVYPYPEGIKEDVVISERGRVIYTFTKTVDSINSVLIYAGISGKTRGNGIIIRNVKIEKGNKATDWTPAVEDIDEAITKVDTKIDDRVADVNISLDGITSRVSRTETNINTINGDVKNLNTRVSTAEQKIEPDRIINTVTKSDIYQNDLSGKTSPTEVKSIIEQSANEVQTAFNGATGKFIIKNGNLQIKNIDDETVFDSDTYGNLRIAGQYNSTFLSQNGKVVNIKLGDTKGFMGRYTEKAGLQFSAEEKVNGGILTVGEIYCNVRKPNEGLTINSEYGINLKSTSDLTGDNFAPPSATFYNGVDYYESIYTTDNPIKKMTIAPRVCADVEDSTIIIRPEHGEIEAKEFKGNFESSVKFYSHGNEEGEEERHHVLLSRFRSECNERTVAHINTLRGDIETKGVMKARDFETEHGSVVERSTWGADEIVKFADGTQIIHTKRTDEWIDITNPYGSFYQGPYNWTFPVSFIKPPTVLCTEARVGTGASWAAVRQVSTTMATITVLDIVKRPIAYNLNIGIMAIGRWR